MPFAPLIKKQILAVIVDEIIPLLESVVVRQVSAEPPFYLYGAAHRPIRQTPLPNQGGFSFDLLTHWKEDYVLAKNMPHLGFLYRGANDERWGITDKMGQVLEADGKPVPPGVTSIRLVAPCVCYIPAGIPRTDGRYTQRAAELEQYESMGKLSIDFTPVELFVYLYSEKTGATHHLHVVDRHLPQQLQKYGALLEAGQLAQGQRLLLEVMTALVLLLRGENVRLSNSSWPPLQESALTLSDSISQANFRICYNAIQYIQLHLNTPLTRDKIALAIGISPIHLNRVFKRETGLTIMHFVTQYRLNAARQMLGEKKELVGEIATLVGFASLHSMSIVFKRAYGMSPRVYRQKILAVRFGEEKPKATRSK